jgi:PAS domain S-box-containing protein
MKMGNLLLINEAAKNYLEYSPEEMRDKYFLDFISKEDTALINNSLNKVLSKKKPVKFKVHLLTKYGQAIST